MKTEEGEEGKGRQSDMAPLLIQRSGSLSPPQLRLRHPSVEAPQVAVDAHGMGDNWRNEISVWLCNMSIDGSRVILGDGKAANIVVQAARSG